MSSRVMMLESRAGTSGGATSGKARAHGGNEGVALVDACPAGIETSWRPD